MQVSSGSASMPLCRRPRAAPEGAPLAHTLAEVARALFYNGSVVPFFFYRVSLIFREGHIEIWRAADAALFWGGLGSIAWWGYRRPLYVAGQGHLFLV